MANTPTRPIRLDLNDWQEFGELCKAAGTDRSTEIRNYIKWAIQRPEGPKRLTRPVPKPAPE